MIIINRYHLSLARDFNNILNESINQSWQNIKDAKDKGNKLLKSLNDIDLTSDSSSEGIYYALSSFLGLSIIMSHIPLIPHVISTATAHHLNHKVLPKYRIRLTNVYTAKVRDIDEKISELKNKIEDENEGDINQEIESLEVVRDQLQRDLEKLKVIRD